MAIAISGNQTAQSTASANTYTLTSYTPAAGSNRVLVVRVHGLRSSDAETFLVSGVTFGGVALSEAVTASQTSTARKYRCAIWYLVNPSGSAGDIVVSLSHNSLGIVIAADTLTGADQSTPLGDTGSDNATPNAAIGIDVAVNNLVLMAATSHCLSNPSWIWDWTPNVSVASAVDQYTVLTGSNVNNEVSGNGSSIIASASDALTAVTAQQGTSNPQAAVAAEFIAAATVASFIPPPRPRTYIRM